MTYLDTGCLVKLYYPEPDSPQVIALVQGQPLFFTPLHELEMTNALQLKVFSKSATAAQAAAARALVATDLQSGVLVSTDGPWQEVFAEAIKLAGQHSGTMADHHNLELGIAGENGPEPIATPGPRLNNGDRSLSAG